MSTSTSIENPEEFKRFINNLQRVLDSKNQDLRTLKLSKALHSGAEAMGFKNWHQMLAFFDNKEMQKCAQNSQDDEVGSKKDLVSELKIINCILIIVKWTPESRQ